MAMKILDLFSGLKGWSNIWKQNGHDVYCVEIDEKFDANWRGILTFDKSKLPWQPDIILASPPCTAFSVMQIGRNWTKQHEPKTEAAKHGLRLLNKTIELIHDIKPKHFVIENPRGKMRKLPQMQQFNRLTVTYCQYGESRMKPTDLWGGFKSDLILKPPCNNGDSCHISSPRGSTNGTQGMDKHLAAKIPELLAKAFYENLRDRHSSAGD